MRTHSHWLTTELERRGVPRREFMGFCATMAAALALPDAAAAQIARAVQRAEKPVLLWLEFQDCAGNTESFLRASRPSAAEVILDILSVDYHETIMAAAGKQAEQNRDNAIKQRAGDVHRRHRRIDSHGCQRRILHDRRPRGHRHRARGVRERGRHDRDRHVRRLRRHSRGSAESDRRTGRGRRRPRRQESDQSVGVSGERRESDRAPRALSHLQDVAGARPPPPAAFRVRQIDPRRVRAARALRRRPVRRSVGRRRTSPGLLPVQDGLQRPRHIPELSQRPLEWRHELADRLRPSVHRMRRAGLLGSNDAVLSAPVRRAGIRRGLQPRHDRACGGGRCGRRVRRPRAHSDHEAPSATRWNRSRRRRREES